MENNKKNELVINTEKYEYLFIQFQEPSAGKFNTIRFINSHIDVLPEEMLNDLQSIYFISLQKDESVYVGLPHATEEGQKFCEMYPRPKTEVVGDLIKTLTQNKEYAKLQPSELICYFNLYVKTDFRNFYFPDSIEQNTDVIYVVLFFDLKKAYLTKAGLLVNHNSAIGNHNELKKRLVDTIAKSVLNGMGENPDLFEGKEEINFSLN